MKNSGHHQCVGGTLMMRSPGGASGLIGKFIGDAAACRSTTGG